MAGFKFNNKHTNEFGLILLEREISPPSKNKIKRKRTVSPEWKKVQEFCAHHDIEIVTDPKTGKPIVKVIDLE